MARMVVVNGIRYRAEDAERRGLVSAAEKPKEKARQLRNKAVTPENK